MRETIRTALFGVGVLLAGVGSSSSAPPRVAETGGGILQFLHGTVVTEDGRRYTGVLRWGTEESFWDDLFDGAKGDLPYVDRQPDKERPRHEVMFLGFLPLGYFEKDDQGRRFAARFGDIKEIRPLADGGVELAMKSGTKYRLDGASNDIGAVVHVDDPASGSVELHWGEIDRIVLEPAPASAPQPKARRLFGEVATEGGTFKGFIQWDSEECLSTDRLDGDSDVGRVSLEMGKIRTIEKKGDDAVRVETNDGRKVDLQGTNDVNGSIRGIFVEDERYGRVRVSWQAFRRIDLRETAAVGRRYDDYPPGRSLRGTVTDRNGTRWQGRIVFDLDETETWEMLDGERQGIVYSVPFERIRSLEPLGDRTTMVSLRNGQKLQLGETQDVNEKNAGVLVLSTGAAPEHYVSWGRVARLDLD